VAGEGELINIQCFAWDGAEAHHSHVLTYTYGVPFFLLSTPTYRYRFIPTTSNDAIWNGILQWYGLTSDADLDYCLPNRQNTINPYLGTDSPLLTMADLFEVEGGDIAPARKLRRSG
jgi:hypothetical protein